MSGEENKAIIRRFVEECVNTGDISAVDTFVDTNVVFHPVRPGPNPGIEGIKQSFTWFHTVFPDLHITSEDLVAEGDTVVGRWTARGTHQAELNGIPPTGKHITWAGIDIYRIIGGKITDWWREQDTLGMMQQLGAIPAPDQAAS